MYLVYGRRALVRPDAVALVRTPQAKTHAAQHFELGAIAEQSAAQLALFPRTQAIRQRPWLMALQHWKVLFCAFVTQARAPTSENAGLPGKLTRRYLGLTHPTWSSPERYQSTRLQVCLGCTRIDRQASGTAHVQRHTEIINDQSMLNGNSGRDSTGTVLRVRSWHACRSKCTSDCKTACRATTRFARHIHSSCCNTGTFCNK